MKYRQPGYRDADFAEQRDRERKEERDTHQEARQTRHAVSRDARSVVRCAECGHQSAGETHVDFETTCDNCSAALHSCRNCRFLDTRARFHCRQEIPERVASKTAANTCEFFEPRRVLDSTGKRVATAQENPRSAFDALFKK
ncbi:MAG: hypothetical protein ACE5IK_11535 [Acidobacteriota bacterium]